MQAGRKGAGRGKHAVLSGEERADEAGQMCAGFGGKKGGILKGRRVGPAGARARSAAGSVGVV